jgi:phospholipid/cholesterol/gamma-HCH transport system permease protein
MKAGIALLGRSRAGLAAVGAPVVAALRWLIGLAAMSAAVVVLAAHGSTWRRTVKDAFTRELRDALLGSLPAAGVLALLVGLGLVYQALYWLGDAGQMDLVGQVIAAVVVRELAPMMVAMILIGRSGSAVLIELTQMRSGGQLRMLDGLGVDPFLVYVVPRTIAMAIACFVLTVLFIAATLLVGYVSASSLGVVRVNLASFADLVVNAMGAGDYLLVPAKALAVGFAIGVICCHTALSRPRESSQVVAIGFVRAALAAIGVSGLLTLAL